MYDITMSLMLLERLMKTPKYVTFATWKYKTFDRSKTQSGKQCRKQSMHDSPADVITVTCNESHYARREAREAGSPCNLWPATYGDA